MKKNLLKAVGYGLASVACLLIATDPAMAQGINGNGIGLNNITTNIKDQFVGIVDVMSGLAYIGGIGFGIKSGLKLKEYNESQGKTPLSTPIMLMLVAAILIALPTFLTTGQQSVFGSNFKQTSVKGGGDLIK